MTYTVAVRELCEFVAKQGDLDLRFTPAPTAQEGIAGHNTVTARRSAGYQKEIALSGTYQQLLVRGRADGYDPTRNQLEEIKTFRGDLARMPENHRHLHWAQVKIYGWLLCQQLQLSELNVALVYFDIVTQKETLESESHSALALQTFFEQHCSTFLTWAEQELAHQQTRNQALQVLGFPHPAFRTGQRVLAENVYKAAHTGRCLMAQAPTGIGKTMGTLFPLLKAVGANKLDKVFYLAAKTSGRALAREAIGKLGHANPGLPLRALEMVARDKTCEHPDKACHGESCPLAKGFYDRLPAARQAALTLTQMDQPSLRETALAHQVCPYYLSQEMARWADVVIGDYNYYFDASALLHGLSVTNQWQTGVLVDEAHNLLERARSMYSAQLEQTSLKALRKTAPASLKAPLERVNRLWSALVREQTEPYAVHCAPPDKLLLALQNLIGEINEHLTEQPAGLSPQLQNFYFDAMQFCRIAETFGDHSLFDITRRVAQGKPATTLCLRNVVPAPFLQPRFAASQTTVLFSATLSPAGFYADTLGLSPDTAWVDVPSPFTADQLSVNLVEQISTRFQDRAASVAPIVALIGQQYARQPGNYLAFFSSFEYLQQVASALALHHPAIPQWVQKRQMSEPERAQFLAQFTVDGRGIGLAVLGGAFAEGIDLPGNRLIGAFVATLGLPQVNPVNEQIRQRMTAIFGDGYDYTYLYPGLQKVVQAAGRVIRTQQDRGIIYLIDDRFGWPKVRRLLPDWWHINTAASAARALEPQPAGQGD